MKLKLYTLFILLLCGMATYSQEQAPDWAWAKSAEGNGYDWVNGIITDAIGNVYITGYFDGTTITFGNTILTNANEGRSDIFIVKYAPNGNVIWAKRAGGNENDRSNNITTDEEGNVYLTGYFGSSTLTFGTTTLTNTGGTDIFIVKYTATGNVVWAKSADGGYCDEGTSITTDEAENVYLTGYFKSNSITFGNITLNNSGNNNTHDIFIAKYNSNGNEIWAKSFGGSSADYGTSITTDKTGNIYFIGNFSSSTITFGNTTLTQVGGGDIFFAKCDINGNVIWAKSFGGSSYDGGISIITDEIGSVYFTGSFMSSTVIFDTTTLTNINAGYYDIFIVKYNPNGNMIWAKSAGGGDNDVSNSISTDKVGNVYLTGDFSFPNITFGDITLTNAGYDDIFITEYDSNGNVLWAKRAGSDNFDYGRSITTDAMGNIYLTGDFWSNTITFGNTTLNNTGFLDVFTTRLNLNTGNNGPVCEGYPLNVTVSANPEATFVWTGPNGFSSTEQNPVVSNSATTAMSGTYDVTVTLNGMSGTGSTQVTVKPMPSTPVVSNNGPVCSGNVLSLTASTIPDATYFWTGPNGFTSTEQNPVVSYNSTTAMSGTYNVTATVNGCTSPAGSTTVVVNETPATPMAGNNGPICEGSELSLTASFVPDATYLWTGPNGFTSIEQNPIVSNNATIIMSGTYSVTASLNNGCISDVSLTQVTVKPMPSTPIAGNNGPVCSGNVLSLTASTIPDATYLWTGPNGFTSTEQNPIVSNNATTIMSGTYNVTATVNGCTSPAGSTTVIVNETPATPMAGNNSPVCEGSELSLTASFVPEATYLWTGPNGFTSTEQNPMVSNNATTTMSGTYSVTASLSNGCTSDVSLTQVTVNAIPSTPVAGSNGPVCEGSALMLNTSYVWNASYSWTGPNGFTSSEQNPVVSYQATPAMSGSYYITVTVNGCSSPAGSVIATVNATPETPIAENNGPVCLGSMLSLSASTIPNASYHWTGPNGFVSSEQNPDVSNNAQPGMSGLYYVAVTDNNGCVSESGLTNVSIIDVQPTPNICVISVDSIKGKNLVVWDKPLTGAIHHFNVFVEGNQANVFEHIGTVDYNSVSIYIDTLSAPAQQAYRYKISAVDTCGNETELSDYHKSIHLSISQGMGTTFNLAWSHYEGFSYSTYNIYRGTTPASMILLTTVSSTIDSYTDLTPPAGYVYYQIEAVNPNPCSIFKQTNYNSARSNIVSNNTNAVPEYPNESEISIYPNPANDNLTIIIPTYSAVNHTTLELFDIYGNLLKNVTVTGNTTTVDISGYPAGVYVVRFMDEKGIVSKRIIKR